MNLLEYLKNYWDANMGSLKDKGVTYDVIQRFGHIDMAYPSSVEEYIALRGCTVILIGTITDNKDEVPVERAYFESERVELCPMRNLSVCIDDGESLHEQVHEVKTEKGKIYFQNFSFWAFPLAWFGQQWKMGVDFKSDRKNFSILRGPMEFPGHINDCIKKECSKQLKVVSDFDDNAFGGFIEREFIHNNRFTL